MADLFVEGIEDKVGDLTDWPVAPGAELLVEFGRRPAHLSRGDLKAAEFLHNGRDLPGADSLHVHFGDGERHRPFNADASLERPRLKRPPVLVTVAASLGDPQIHLADASRQGLGLGSVGVALTIGSSLIRLGLEHLLSLDLHGVIHERRAGRCNGRWAMLDEHGP